MADLEDFAYLLWKVLKFMAKEDKAAVDRYLLDCFLGEIWLVNLVYLGLYHLYKF